MKYLKSNGISHYDWFIEVIPQRHRYSFRCYHPNLEGFQTDASTYRNPESALIAGCRFVNRELALMALQGVLEEMMQDEKITLHEYWNLANFL